MAFRSATTATSGAGTTTSIAVPAGVQVGDIVILIHSDDGPNGAITWPSGFTQLDKRFISTDGQNIGIAWKRLTSVDSGSYTITHPNPGLANGDAELCLAFSGRDGTNPPVLTVGSQATGTGTVTVSATLTAVTGDDLLFAILTDPSASATATFTPPAGFTDEADVNGSSYSHAEAGTEDGVAAGSITASGSVNSTSSKAVVPYFVRIPAAAGSGGGPVSGEVDAVSGTTLTAAAQLVAAGLTAAVTAATLAVGVASPATPNPVAAASTTAATVALARPATATVAGVTTTSTTATGLYPATGTIPATSGTSLSVGLQPAGGFNAAGTVTATSTTLGAAQLLAPVTGGPTAAVSGATAAPALLAAATGHADAVTACALNATSRTAAQPGAAAAVSTTALAVGLVSNNAFATSGTIPATSSTTLGVTLKAAVAGTIPASSGSSLTPTARITATGHADATTTTALAATSRLAATPLAVAAVTGIALVADNPSAWVDVTITAVTLHQRPVTATSHQRTVTITYRPQGDAMEDRMELDPYGRELYRLGITTTPTVDSWDASFDGGLTWTTGTVIDGDYTWLLAGPAADPGSAVAVITKTTQPKIRATANPEIVVRDAPWVVLNT